MKIEVQVFADEPARFFPYIREHNVASLSLDVSGAVEIRAWDPQGKPKTLTVGPQCWHMIRIDQGARP